MKVLFLLYTAFIGAGIFFLSACTKGGDLSTATGDVYTISANATGTQVVPVSASSGTGSITGFYDGFTKTLTYTIRWSGLWQTTGVKDTITSALFYGNASAGQNGDSLRMIYIPTAKMLNPLDSILNSLSGTMCLSSREEADIISGKWYYAMYSKKYPKGLIRGQLNARKQ